MNERWRNPIERAVAANLAGHDRVVLAVSGGLDSMVLLHTVARVAPSRVEAIATFDHATGPHATAAAEHVAASASALGFVAVIGRPRVVHRHEAGWREERWRFLREVASGVRGIVVTAHTEDDQIETILMRAMRGAGARGLAGLLAATPSVLRPLLAVSRAELARHAAESGIRYLHDPTNESRLHFRNRVRLDILPALLSVRPTLRDDLLGIGRSAARWRRELESIVDDFLPPLAGSHRTRTRVASAPLVAMEAESLAVVWPVIAARIGVALDRRGIARLVALAKRGKAGTAVQISGGWTGRRLDEAFEIARVSHPAPAASELGAESFLRWGEWYFRAAPDDGSLWSAAIPPGTACTVRSWAPGDRMKVAGGRLRKVKRLLSDAGIQGSRRVGWPVVLVDGEIRWIPGVCRSDAATERSGRPGVSFNCERSHG